MLSLIQSPFPDDQNALALLINVSVKAAVVLALAWMVCRIFRRRSAAVHHGIWTIAVAVSLLMPLAVGFAPHVTIAVLPERWVAGVETNETPVIISETAPDSTVSTTVDSTRSLQVPQVNLLPESNSQAAGSLSALPSALPVASGEDRSVSISRFLVSLWLVGVGVVGTPFFLMLLVQWLRNRRLGPIQDESWNAHVAAAARRLRLGRTVRTFESAGRTVPAVYGIFRSYVVVPDNWRDWSDEQRTCILLHELAHVKRFDVATQFLGRLMAIFYWFNPLAWYALGQLRTERELACDDCVLMSGERASLYAEELLRTLRQYRTKRFALGVAMASSARLDQRILAILDRSRCRLPRTTTMDAIGVLCAGALTVVLGAASFAAPPVADGPQKTTAVPANNDGDGRQAPLDSEDPELAARFKGRVTGPDGRPFGGARVFIVPEDPSDDEVGQVRAVTGADGRFEFVAHDMTFTSVDGLPRRRVGLLIATAEGFAPDWTETWGRARYRSIRKPANGENLELQLGTDAPIHGRFLDADGRPLAGAVVRLDELMIPVKRDLDVHLEIEKKLSPVSNGDYERTLRRPGLIPGLRTETQTDVDGRFKFSGIGRDRIVQLSVSAPSVVDTELKVMSRDGPNVQTRLGGSIRDFPESLHWVIHGGGFELQLKRGLTITGLVSDRETGRPIPGMWVGWRGEALSGLNSGTYPRVTDENGRFRVTGLDPRLLEWKEHDRTFTAVAQPGLPYQTATGVVDDDLDVLIECPRGIPFRLKVLDEQGQPVDADVTSVNVQPNPHGLVGGRGPVSRAAKKGDGTYEGFVVPGPGALLVKTPAQANYRPAHVDPKAFFAPGRTEWTPQEQISSYGTQDTLSTTDAWINQHDYSAIVLVNPEMNSGALDLTATVAKDVSHRITLIDSDGKPVVGAQTKGMTFHPWDAEPRLRAASFFLTGLHPDRLRRITFTQEDRQLIGFLAARGPDETPGTVRMQPWGTVRGRLVDHDGTPLTYQRAGTLNLGTGSSGIAINVDPEVGEEAGAKTDADGRFQIDKLVPGQRYTARIYHGFGRSMGSAFENLVLTPGEVRDLGDIQTESPDDAESTVDPAS